MAEPKDRGAVLQIEIDVARFVNVANVDYQREFNGETPWGRIHNLACTAVRDTIRNGGTFVLVRDGNTITMVQRPKDAGE